MRKLFFLFTFVVVCARAVSAQTYSGGNGSEATPYLISTKADMEALSNAVAGGNSYSGQFFALQNDLTGANALTASVGVIEDPSGNFSFQGTFDGKGYEIALDNTPSGVFVLIKNATVKNLKVTGQIVIGPRVFGRVFAGGVCSYAINSTIDHCSNAADITSGLTTVVTAGGICGYNQGSTVSSCSNSGLINTTPSDILVSGVIINPSAITYLTKGAQPALKATVLPPNVLNKTVTWTSSDPTVASVDTTTVDINGVVTTISDGQTTITATSFSDPSQFATCEVTVKTPADGLTITQEEVTYSTPGEQPPLVVVSQPDGTPATNVEWTSDNPNVVTIDDNGVPTVHGCGTATITVVNKDDNTTTTSTVNVDIPVTGITSLTPETVNLTAVNASAQLAVALIPSDACATGITWTSSDPTVATVDQNGVVTALKYGETIITATAQGNTALSTTRLVTVNIPVVGVTIQPSAVTYSTVGAQSALTATVLPAEVLNKTVTWSSSDRTVATVDQNGVVTTIKNGTTTITATSVSDPSKSGIGEVTVKIAADGLTITQEEVTYSTPGEQPPLVVVSQPAGTPATNVEWTSDDPNVVTIDDNGIPTVHGCGTATITVVNKDDNTTTTTTVNVDIPVIGISIITPGMVNLTAVNATAQLAVSLIPGDACATGITWTSSNPTVATVDATGVVTALKYGTTTVTATVQGNTALSTTRLVSVNIPATAITMSPQGPISLMPSGAGSTQLFTASVIPAEANQAVTWSSASSAIASVDAVGNVTAVSGNGGQTSIRAASVATPATTADVTVNVVSPQSNAIIINKTTLPVGETLTLSVIEVQGATYAWTYPTANFDLTSGDGTNSIVLTAKKVSRNVAADFSVTVTNAGNSASRVATQTVTVLPSQPSAITTGTGSLAVGATVTLSVEDDAQATGYIWTYPTANFTVSGSSTTHELVLIAKTVSSNAASGFSVIATSALGNSASRVATQAVAVVPTQPDAINYTFTTLDAGTITTLSVTNDIQATGYTWTFPANFTGSSTSNSIILTANTPGGFSATDFSVVANSGSGNSAVRTGSAVTVGLAAPATLSANTTSIANGTTVTLSAATVIGATGYAWTYPIANFDLTTGAGTNSIVLTAKTVSANANTAFSVKAINGTIESSPTTSSNGVDVKPAQPSAITTSVSSLPVGATVTLSVVNDDQATGYTWTYPIANFDLTSGDGTNSIVLTAKTMSTNVAGDFSVIAMSAVGNSASRVATQAVAVVPAQPSVITYTTTTLDAGETTTLSVTNDDQATGYTWTFPANFTGSSTLNSIILTANTPGSFTAAGFSVVANSTFGSSAARTGSAVTVGLANATTLTSNATSVAVGSTVTLTASEVAGADKYEWAFPTNFTSNGSTSNVLVLTGATPSTNDKAGFTVKASNTAGTIQSASTFALTTGNITVIPAATSAINFSARTVNVGSDITVSVDNVANTTYAWVVPSSNFTITSGQGTNSITVQGAFTGTDIDASGFTVTPTVNLIAGAPTQGTGNVSVGLAAPATLTASPLTVVVGEKVTLTAAAVAGISAANGYEWTIPAGFTGTTPTNDPTIDLTSTAIATYDQSAFAVTAVNGSIKSSALSSTTGTVTVTPVATSAIDFSARTLNVGEDITVSVTSVANTTYTWVVPNNFTIEGDATRNSITVRGASVGDNIDASGFTVTPMVNLVAGAPTPGTGNVSVGLAAPTTLTASPLTVVVGEKVTLTAAAVAGVSATNGYEWTIPAGFTGTTPTTTPTIVLTSQTVDTYAQSAFKVTAANGTIKSNAKESTTGNITVTPAATSAINFSARTLNVGSDITVSVDNVANTTYAWVVPDNFTITAGQGTHSITVEGASVGTGIAASGFTVTPTVNSVAGATTSGADAALTVGLATPATLTASPLTVVVGEKVTLTAAAVAGVSGTDGYEWTIPAGFTGTTPTNDPTIDLTSTAIATYDQSAFKVTAANGPIKSNAKESTTGNITVTPVATSAINFSDRTVNVGSDITVSVDNVANTTYTWVVPNNFTITAGQGTHSITVEGVSVGDNIAASGFTVTPTVNLIAGAPTPGTGNVSVGLAAPATLTASPLTVVVGEKVTLTAGAVAGVSGTNGYEWTIPAGFTGTTPTNGTSIVLTSTTAGTYAQSEFKVTAANGSIKSDAKESTTGDVKVIPADPTITLPNSLTINFGETLTFTASPTGTETYTWVYPTDYFNESGQGTATLVLTAKEVTDVTGLTIDNIKVTATSPSGNSSQILGSGDANIIIGLAAPASVGVSHTTRMKGEALTVTADVVAGATEYVFTFPANFNGGGTTVTQESRVLQLTTSVAGTIAAGDIKVAAKRGTLVGTQRGSGSAVTIHPCTAVPTVTIAGTTATYNLNTVAGSVTALEATSTDDKGGTLSYQWQSSSSAGDGYTDINGATSATYKPLTSAAGTLYYKLKVTTDCGTATSTNYHTVTVRDCSDAPTVSITATTPTYNLNAGSVTALTATVDVKSGAATYQWMSCTTSNGSYGNASGGSGSTSASYTPPTTTAGTLYYKLKVTTACGTATSANYHTVTVRDCSDAPTVSITATTPTYNLNAGSVTALTATVDVKSGAATYQWMSCTTSNGTYGNASGGSGSTSASYTPPTTTACTLYYKLKVTTACGTATSTNYHTVTVRDCSDAPTVSITATTPTYNLNAGSVTALTATVDVKSGAATYQWMSCTTSNGTYGNASGGSGSTSASYTPPTTTACTLYYKLKVTTACGTATSANYHTVTVRDCSDAPTVSITATTPTYNLNAGSVTALTATVDVKSGAATYQWMSCTTSNGSYGNASGGSGSTSASYTPPTTTAGTLYYKLKVTTACGTATSANYHTVTVRDCSDAPTVSITATTPTYNLNAGSVTALTATVDVKSGAATYQWMSCTTSNGSYGNASGGSGSTSASYTPPTTTAGTLYYKLKVTTACGTATSANYHTVTVRDCSDAPTVSITATTPTYNLNAGSVTALTATVDVKSGAATYQWMSCTTSNGSYGNASGGSGSTSASYTPPTTTAGTLYYKLKVTTACGTATSTNYHTVTVRVCSAAPATPSDITGKPSGDVEQNSTYTLRVTKVTAGTQIPTSYAWTLTGSHLSVVTASTGDTIVVKADTVGTYDMTKVTVTATNACGNAAKAGTGTGTVKSACTTCGTVTVDNKTYKTATFGAAGEWMVENLARDLGASYYGIASSVSDFKPYYHTPGSVANTAAAVHTTKYGGGGIGYLYTWAAAMKLDQFDARTMTHDTPYQGICPDGWHVPTNAEWTKLYNAIADAPSSYSTSESFSNKSEGPSGTVGAAFLSPNQPPDGFSWDDFVPTSKSADAGGFNGLLCGWGLYGEGTIKWGETTVWWTSTSTSKDNAYYRQFYRDGPSVQKANVAKRVAASIRCKKD